MVNSLHDRLEATETYLRVRVIWGKLNDLNIARWFDTFQTMPVPLLDPICRDTQHGFPLASASNALVANILPKANLHHVFVIVH